MHRALKARPVKGCMAAVCELDRTELVIKVNRIPNFSAFHNFSYEEAQAKRVCTITCVVPG